ncbi:MAG: hypothetical protein R2681_13570 [Pyrinomonadaceae bacterium]
MKKYLISAFTVASVLLASFVFFAPRQSAAANNDVAELALMLPETDVIVAVDMNTALNVVRPSLLDNDEKKLENLRKLMVSLENSIGIDPYEIRQIVAGIKLASTDDKDMLENMDLTVILRTANSNDALLESWSKRMDQIRAFEIEKKPTEKYIDIFKEFRTHAIDEEEAKTLAAFKKDFEEILTKANALKVAMDSLPAATKSTKIFKDAASKNKALIELVLRCQKLLNTDTNIKPLSNDSMRLQNRWTETTLDDPQKTAKLAEILTEAKALYPRFRSKAEAVAKVDAVLNLTEYAFYEIMIDRDADQFTDDDEDDELRAPNDEIKVKLDELIKEIRGLPAARFAQTKKLTESFKTLANLEEIMKIRLSPADELEPLKEVEEEKQAQAPAKSFSQTLRENAKISEVNGKRLISIDTEKVDLWNERSDVPAGVEEKDETEEIEKPEPLVRINVVTAADPLTDTAKKEPFAIGYLDETTLVLGYEPGIRSILERKEGYRNPKAAEMISSFKSPLVSFASNSKIIKGLLNAVKKLESADDKEPKKKVDPFETFFSDINIFGAVEYESTASGTNDIMVSLGFTKNSVEDLFKPEEPETDDTVIEIGDYQLGEALFYDLMNTLKAYKASMTFKFEKKKLAALIEKAPAMIENSGTGKSAAREKSARREKIRIQSFEEILTSPDFIGDLITFVKDKNRN